MGIFLIDSHVSENNAQRRHVISICVSSENLMRKKRWCSTDWKEEKNRSRLPGSVFTVREFSDIFSMQETFGSATGIQIISAGEENFQVFGL